jgi:collagen type III alpha
MGMMPPPSPAQNGANKDQGGSKDSDASRNAPGNAGHTPNAGGTAPTTPAPGTSGPGPQGPPPQTNGAPTASPSSILGAPLNAGPLGNQQSVLPDAMFPPDFMQQLSSLDDFDSNIFRNDGDINFERDFGQWFNGDDASLDMK